MDINYHINHLNQISDESKLKTFNGQLKGCDRRKGGTHSEIFRDFSEQPFLVEAVPRINTIKASSLTLVQCAFIKRFGRSAYPLYKEKCP